MYRIFVVENDPMVAQEICFLLNKNGYRARHALSPVTLVEEIKRAKPHLLLLEVNLSQAKPSPVFNGLTISKIVHSTYKFPVLYAANTISDLEQIHSISTQNDSYIEKPYSFTILLSKLSTLLKRAYPIDPHASLFECDGVTLQAQYGFICYLDQQIKLTDTETKILHYLFLHQGSICSRREILDYLWAQQLFIDDSTLSVFLVRLTKKLEEIGIIDFIHTPNQNGYLI